MRLKNIILWDMRFQMKYGFYLLYAILTLFYLAMFFAMPESWRQTAAVLLILSDPAAMGLFFMGAIVLLEKSQHVSQAMAVSPVKPEEYIAGKVISLCFISIIVAGVLAVCAEISSLFLVLAGTASCSVLFTLAGIITASEITSLNQFILWTVPVEFIGFAPAVLHLLHLSPIALRYYPVNVCMDMIAGRSPDLLQLAAVLLSAGLLFAVARQRVLTMWQSMGGVKI